MTQLQVSQQFLRLALFPKAVNKSGNLLAILCPDPDPTELALAMATAGSATAGGSGDERLMDSCWRAATDVPRTAAEAAKSVASCQLATIKS